MKLFTSCQTNICRFLRVSFCESQRLTILSLQFWTCLCNNFSLQTDTELPQMSQIGLKRARAVPVCWHVHVSWSPRTEKCSSLGPGLKTLFGKKNINSWKTGKNLSSFQKVHSSGLDHKFVGGSHSSQGGWWWTTY